MSYLPGTEGVSVAMEGAPAPRLLDEVRRHSRLKYYSLRTEQAYIGWIRRFILGNGKRHPRAMGAAGTSLLPFDTNVRATCTSIGVMPMRWTTAAA
jgi:hypothetical protein